MDVLTILGSGSELNGTLSVEGTVQIEGKFTGKINTTGGVVITAGAKVKADINAATVLIEGQVEGVIRATTLIELRASARMIGTLAAPELAIARGATFVGSCEMKPAGGSNRRPEAMSGESRV